FVRDYVAAHPSRSHTLNRLGDHVPEFIARNSDLPRREVCSQLARLQLPGTQVFDSGRERPLREDAVAAVHEDGGARARCRPPAAFGLLASRDPFTAYRQRGRDGDHGHHPRRRLKSEWVAFYRRASAVYRLDLTSSAHDLLADLVAGEALGEAIAA